MAVIDPRSDAVVIRVVYDGPPLAGKTTSVRALARGLGGSVTAPEEVGGRTLFFDWLDYTGGLFEGRRIRCQIVSVPGQATLATRRRRLLEAADVVVFVGDSAAEEVGAAQSYLEGLRSVLARLPGPPVGIVYQANKRDRDDALPLDELRAMLDRAGGRIALVESVAIEGAGVRETFVFAVRLALDRVRELMRGGALAQSAPAVDSAADLLAELRGSEGAALDLAAESGLRHTRLHDVRAVAPAAQLLQQSVRDNGPARDAVGAGMQTAEPSSADAPASPPATANGAAVASVADSEPPPALPGSDLPSGMVWPPVNGRLILHEATSAAVTLRRHVNANWIGTTASGWVLQSPAGAGFAALDAGHRALVAWARIHAASAHLLSSERCILLARDGRGGYRLWQVIRRESSLRDELDQALRSGPEAIAKVLLTLTRAFVSAADRFGSAGCWLPLKLRTLGSRRGGSCFLGALPDPRAARPAETRSPAAALRLLTAQLEYALPELEACRDEALAMLDGVILPGRGAPLDPTHGFVRRYLDALSV